MSARQRKALYLLAWLACIACSATVRGLPHAHMQRWPGGRYGSVSECLCAGTPMVFLRRDYFNEEPFLRRLLQLHGGGAARACRVLWIR
jgi:hypothetical protein